MLAMTGAQASCGGKHKANDGFHNNGKDGFRAFLTTDGQLWISEPDSELRRHLVEHRIQRFHQHEAGAVALSVDGVLFERSEGREWKSSRLRIASNNREDVAAAYVAALRVHPVGKHLAGEHFEQEFEMNPEVLRSLGIDPPVEDLPDYSAKDWPGWPRALSCESTGQPYMLEASPFIDSELSLSGVGTQRTLDGWWSSKDAPQKRRVRGSLVLPESWKDSKLRVEAKAAAKDMLLFTVERGYEPRWFLASPSEVRPIDAPVRHWNHDVVVGLDDGRFAYSSFEPFSELALIDAQGGVKRPFVPYVPFGHDAVSNHDGMVTSGEDAGLFWGASARLNTMVGLDQIAPGPRLIHIAFASGRREALTLDFALAMHTPCTSKSKAPRLTFYGVAGWQDVDGLHQWRGKPKPLRPEVAVLRLHADGEFCVARTSRGFEAPGDGTLVAREDHGSVVCRVVRD